MMTRVERVGAGTVMARRGKAHEISATTKTKERNIRALLLRKRVLSRGNWRSGAGSAEADSRRPRQERRKGDIEICHGNRIEKKNRNVDQESPVPAALWPARRWM